MKCGIASRSSGAQCFPATLTALSGRNNDCLRVYRLFGVKFRSPECLGSIEWRLIFPRVALRLPCHLLDDRLPYRMRVSHHIDDPAEALTTEGILVPFRSGAAFSLGCEHHMVRAIGC